MHSLAQKLPSASLTARLSVCLDRGHRPRSHAVRWETACGRLAPENPGPAWHSTLKSSPAATAHTGPGIKRRETSAHLEQELVSASHRQHHRAAQLAAAADVERRQAAGSDGRLRREAQAGGCCVRGRADAGGAVCRVALRRRRSAHGAMEGWHDCATGVAGVPAPLADICKGLNSAGRSPTGGVSAKDGQTPCVSRCVAPRSALGCHLQ